MIEELFGLSGRTAIVTGSSTGLGQGISLALSGAGANVVGVDYVKSTDTAKIIGERGGAFTEVVADLMTTAPIDGIIEKAVQTYGGLDILVNNAGITRDGLLMMMKPEDFDAVIAANLRGAFLCMKAVARQMVKQRYGRIVNLSSVVGLRGNAGQVNYAASKAGVIGMTKSLAKELAGRNITVNAVAPGFIDTDMTAALTETAKNAALGSIPMGRMGTPENVAKAVAFLASEDAGYITGQVLAVDGGMSM